MSKVHYCAIVSAISLVIASGRGQQPSSKQPTINPVEQRSILRHPNGLQNLSAKVGDVSLTDLEERWGEHDLRSLAQSSQVIISGTLDKAKSRLTDDGDSVRTEYQIQVDHVIKGMASKTITFVSEGGQVQLVTGHTVTLHTPAWDNLKTGVTYILFLEKPDSSYRLTGGSQGLLKVDSADRSVHLIDTDLAHTPELRKRAEGVDRTVVESDVRNLASYLALSLDTLNAFATGTIRRSAEG